MESRNYLSPRSYPQLYKTNKGGMTGTVSIYTVVYLLQKQFAMSWINNALLNLWMQELQKGS